MRTSPPPPARPSRPARSRAPVAPSRLHLADQLARALGVVGGDEDRPRPEAARARLGDPRGGAVGEHVIAPDSLRAEEAAEHVRLHLVGHHGDPDGIAHGSASFRASTTRSWSPASIPVKNGSASDRALASSATGNCPGPKPYASRMYDWRWMHGTYSAVSTPRSRRPAMTASRSIPGATRTV